MKGSPWTLPRHRLADTMADLARDAGWATSRSVPSTESSPGAVDPETDLGSLAAHCGVELRPVRLQHGDLEGFLLGTGPVLLRSLDAPDGYLAVARGGRRRCRVLTEDGFRKVPTKTLLEALTDKARQSAARGVEDLLHDLPVDHLHFSDLGTTLADEFLQDQPAVEGWRLELPPSAPFSVQLRHAGAHLQGLLLLISHTVSTLLLLSSWWMIGRGALSGTLDQGWLWAWALLLLTTIPLRGAEGLARGFLAWQAGALLKRRLLHGALRLGHNERQGLGAGQWFGRVLDSERVEALAMNGGLLTVLAVLELVLAASVLLAGAAPWSHLGLLALTVTLLVIASAAYLRAYRGWTRLRLDLTHRLVERLVGHRTRLAQRLRATWHEAEDRELDAYARRSVSLDRWLPRLQVALPRGWLLAALAALLPTAMLGAFTPARLAVSLGGMLMAFGALRTLTVGIVELAAAVTSWDHVQSLFAAAGRPRHLGSPAAVASSSRSADYTFHSLLEADGVGFRHAERDRDAVHDVDLRISQGERLLLEGPSGGGKSSLIQVLAGLRAPTSGWLGLHGLDRGVWGDTPWRQRVVCVPQPHENFLVTAPLAFNLLMGPRWPATSEDLDEAHQICRELGLGPLLERMPAGIMQPVGDSGWQLSQGERIRVYLARALLQRADLVLLDESLSGLDLENLELALGCAHRRAATLLVVAHP